MNKISIAEIYARYQVPPNLQQHMLWVAGVGKLALDHWQAEEISKKHVLEALLVHDLGNLIKFELNKPESMRMMQTYDETTTSVEKWKQIQQQMVERYGSNADLANELIAQELGLHQETQILLMRHSFERLIEILDQDHWEEKLVFWSDLRIMPQGLASTQDRVQDLRDRYYYRDTKWANPQIYNQWLQASLTLEKQLNQRTSIDLHKITQQDLKSIVVKLTDYQLEIDG